MITAYVWIAAIYTFVLLMWTKMNHSEGKGLSKRWESFWKEHERYEKKRREVEGIRVTTKDGFSHDFPSARSFKERFDTYEILDGDKAIIGKFREKEVVGIFVNRKGEAE